MSELPENQNQTGAESGANLRDMVRSAVIWRSGTQIFGQLITWLSTFLVIRILNPADYGLYAMTGVVLYLLSLVNGYGLANAVIQRKTADRQVLRQLFGMLILMNGALALVQLAIAPLAALYYQQPLVADMLRVQALLYICNPFMALGYAVLARSMEFRRQAQVNLLSAVAGAIAALAGALSGLGVWTLVFAPLVLFGTRAVGMTIAAKSLIRPSFDFTGAWAMASFGGFMTLAQLFWFLQTQTDVFIAGRLFSPHLLGIYTTSLFLVQMFVTKFVPPINEVAFAAYARIQDDSRAIADAFLKSVRIIFLAAIPFCLGLSATAETVVPVVLGAKWLEAAPVIHLLGFAMPFMALVVLYGPAVSAIGKPQVYLRMCIVGAVLMTAAYWIGIQSGIIGLSLAWIAGYALLTLFTSRIVLPHFGVTARELIGALAPPVLAGAAMYGAVRGISAAMEMEPSIAWLALQVLAGGAVYAIAIQIVARERIAEILDLVLRRRSAPPAAA